MLGEERGARNLKQSLQGRRKALVCGLVARVDFATHKEWGVEREIGHELYSATHPPKMH